MPLAMVFIAILTVLSFVGAIESYMLVKIDQSRSATSLAQTEVDNAIETVRKKLAQQIAAHTEVQDISDPGAWTFDRSICQETGAQCTARIENVAVFGDDPSLATPIPSDTPVPCSLPGTDSDKSMHECNLSLGGDLNEQRRVMQISTTIKSQEGRIIASTRRLVRFRVFRLAPYVQIVGVRDPVSTLSVKAVADAGGFDSDGGSKKDTLLRSYAPCRNIPQTAPTPISGKIYNWGEWTNSGPAPAIQVKCDADSGDTSHFQSATVNEGPEINSWGERK